MFTFCRQEVDRYRGPGAPEPTPRALMAACVLPFCDPAPPAAGTCTSTTTPWARPRGFQVTPRLIADLADARPPTADDHWASLTSATWYLDVPDHGILLADDVQLRAIFTQPTVTGDAVLLVAVLTPPGQPRAVARACWYVGRDGRPVGPTVAELVTPLAMDDLRQRITDFVTLVMLYRALAQPNEACELPHMPPEALAKLPAKKARARAKTHSLFRLVRLDSPPDRFGRVAAGTPGDGERGGWHLQHRVRVRGHFTLQPHGPRHALRRLQWIDPHYRGPAEAPERVDLERPHRVGELPDQVAAAPPA